MGEQDLVPAAVEDPSGARQVSVKQFAAEAVWFRCHEGDEAARNLRFCRMTQGIGLKGIKQGLTIHGNRVMVAR
jgi:hypothetical protein